MSENHSNIVSRGLLPTQKKAGIIRRETRADKAGNPVVERGKYGMHSLRHFYASVLIEQGFSPKRVQTLMGHESIQLTYDTYGHLFPSPEDDHARIAKGADWVMAAA
jgi:integrase